MCQVVVRFRGRLDPRWAHWFEGLDVTQTGEGDTELQGELPDQAALYGLLGRMRDLNLTLLSVETVNGG